jgi:hypothetical protein
MAPGDFRRAQYLGRKGVLPVNAIVNLWSFPGEQPAYQYESQGPNYFRGRRFENVRDADVNAT